MRMKIVKYQSSSTNRFIEIRSPFSHTELSRPYVYSYRILLQELDLLSYEELVIDNLDFDSPELDEYTYTSLRDFRDISRDELRNALLSEGGRISANGR